MSKQDDNLTFTGNDSSNVTWIHDVGQCPAPQGRWAGFWYHQKAAFNSLFSKLRITIHFGKRK